MPQAQPDKKGKAKATTRGKGKAKASTRGKGKKKPEPLIDPSATVRTPRKTRTPPNDGKYMAITDVSEVTGPVDSMVDESMALGWKLNNDHPMWLIFDAINPVRQFNRRMKYHDNKDFPAYGPEPWVDLTETDEPHVGLMPYAPILHK